MIIKKLQQHPDYKAIAQHPDYDIVVKKFRIQSQLFDRIQRDLFPDISKEQMLKQITSGESSFDPSLYMKLTRLASECAMARLSPMEFEAVKRHSRECRHLRKRLSKLM
jgi:hypothetical protein